MTDLKVAAVNVHVLNIVQEKIQEKVQEKEKEKDAANIAIE